jgi:hypothetical protein
VNKSRYATANCVLRDVTEVLISPASLFERLAVDLEAFIVRLFGKSQW